MVRYFTLPIQAFGYGYTVYVHGATIQTTEWSAQVTIWCPASLGRGMTKMLEMVIAGNHVRNEKS